MGSCGPWKCVPFESDLQPAVQREGEGEGEVGIAAATCAQGNGFTPDAVPVVWVRVTVRVSPQRPAAASAPSCSLVALLQLGQEWLWLGVLVVGFESRRFSMYHPLLRAPSLATTRRCLSWPCVATALVIAVLAVVISVVLAVVLVVAVLVVAVLVRSPCLSSPCLCLASPCLLLSRATFLRVVSSCVS